LHILSCIQYIPPIPYTSIPHIHINSFTTLAIHTWSNVLAMACTLLLHSFTYTFRKVFQMKYVSHVDLAIMCIHCIHNKHGARHSPSILYNSAMQYYVSYVSPLCYIRHIAHTNKCTDWVLLFSTFCFITSKDIYLHK